jgi:hypothetical protein
MAAEDEVLEPAVAPAALGGEDPAAANDSESAVPIVTLAGEGRPLPSASGVIDEIELERAEITGNQELPKVLYIVPWQKAEAGELVDKPDHGVLEDVLAPIERPEFLRQVDYYGDLHREEE